MTDRNHGEYTADDGLAAALLVSASVYVLPAIWDDPAVNWLKFDLIVIVTTWDYSHHYLEFEAWLGHFV